MSSIVRHLAQYAEEMPAWLREHTPGRAIDFAWLRGSRAVFYPGSGTDGHAVAIFGASGVAHCFLYADASFTIEGIEEQLRPDDSRRFRGYQVLDRVRAPALERGRHPAAMRYGRSRRDGGPDGAANRFQYLVILQREPGAGGPERLAVLFVRDEAVSAYGAWYGAAGASQPTAILLQDHGFGGNWTRFGAGGALEQLARELNVLPRWLLVGANTEPWCQRRG